MNQPERNADPIAKLMSEGAELNESQSRAARDDFLQRIDRELAKPSTKKPLLWAAPMAVAAAVLLALFSWPSSDISFRVTGAANDGGYVRAAERPAILHFSDASQLEARPGTRLRVAETLTNGARVSVEQGTLMVEVTHEDRTSWNFEAGPFDVRVTGTRFEMQWEPTEERLRVELFDGSVEVSGYDASGPVVVRAGQRFLGEVKTRRMEVSDAAPPPPRAASAPKDESEDSAIAPREPEGAAEDGDAPESETADDLAHSKGISEGRSKSEASWSSLVSKGQFSRVVAAARAGGVESCLSSCASTDLIALADAARYTGSGTLAVQSLMALRKRYAAQSGVRAAFLLGRLHESQGKQATALEWYATSLRESPSGSFSAESLAGKMRATLALKGRIAAQPIARDYLRRYPRGVHAAAARRIAEP